jgi:hypothetical protein
MIHVLLATHVDVTQNVVSLITVHNVSVYQDLEETLWSIVSQSELVVRLIPIAQETCSA